MNASSRLARRAKIHAKISRRSRPPPVIERLESQRFFSCWNPHRKMAEATHEGGANARRLAHDLNRIKAPQELLPKDLQLQLGEAVADAAMDAKAKGQMLPRPLTIDDEAVRFRNRRFIAVAGQVPHRQLVALPDLLAAQFRVDQRRAPHVGERCLPADDFGYQTVDERGIGTQLGHLLRMIV